MEERDIEILEGLQANQMLQSLTIHEIGITGLQLIQTILANNKTISEINLPYISKTMYRYPLNAAEKYQYLVRTTVQSRKMSCTNVVNINILWEGSTNLSPDLFEIPHHHFDAYHIALLKFLLCYTTLQTLKVRCQQNNDAIASTIEDCKNSTFLKELIINHHNIGTEVLCKLGLAIQVTIKKLNLSFTKMCDDEVVAISNSFKYNTCLQELNISHNMITSKGVIALSEAVRLCATLKNLNISNNLVTDDGIAVISTSFMCLRELNVSHNMITSKGAKEVLKAAQLQQLDISNNKIFDDGLLAISNFFKSRSFSSLEYLNVSCNCINTLGLLCFLSKIGASNCTLKLLDITKNNVTPSGFTNIKHSIKNLPHTFPIHTSWNEITTDNVGMATLKSMICTLYNNSDDASDDIEQYIWTHEKTFSNTGIILLCDCIKEDNTTQKLNMSGNGITSEGAKSMAEAIKVNTTLQKLDISSNNLSDDGAAAISDCLKNNNSLQELKISGNNITSEGAKSMAEAIKVNTTLQKLDISSNNLSDDGAAAISDCLKNNNSLQELDMSWGRINSEGAKNIAEAIKVNASLQKLLIYQNVVDDGLSFTMTILTAVHHNTTLLTLILPWLSLGERTVVSSEVEKINEERISQGISILNCN